MKIHGKSHVIKVREQIRKLLGIDAKILDPYNDLPASDNVKIASLYVKKKLSKTPEFKTDGRMLIKNLEQMVIDSLGIKIQILAPNEESADPNDTFGALQRKYALASGEKPPLAAWLNSALQRQNWSIEDLSKQTGVNKTTVANIQLGKTQNPHIKTLQKLEKALGEKVPKEVKEEVKEDAETGFGELVDFDPWGDDKDAPIPEIPGVYILYDVSERPVYVGKSETSIKLRINSHKEKKWFTQPFIDKAAYVQINDIETIRKVERLLIKFLKSNAVINEQFVIRRSNYINKNG
jgi:transcriptional regulator with XRE-family HTH domain